MLEKTGVAWALIGVVAPADMGRSGEVSRCDTLDTLFKVGGCFLMGLHSQSRTRVMWEKRRAHAKKTKP